MNKNNLYSFLFLHLQLSLFYQHKKITLALHLQKMKLTGNIQIRVNLQPQSTGEHKFKTK